jgi:L-threonine kinase
MQPTADKTKSKPSLLMRRKAPGTCGEFVQGAIDGQDFLVNCPINLYSHATVYTSDRPGLHLQNLYQFSKIRDAIALVSQGLI